MVKSQWIKNRISHHQTGKGGLQKGKYTTNITLHGKTLEQPPLKSRTSQGCPLSILFSSFARQSASTLQGPKDINVVKKSVKYFIWRHD